MIRRQFEEMLDDRREERTEARLRALGVREPRCSQPGCEERDPFALTGSHPNLLCREHAALAHGRPWLEDHHLAGRANDPTTAAIPGNDHALLSEMQQQEWPRETLRNPEGSPLLRAAACLRGWMDVLWLMLARTVGWIPPFLEWLDHALTATLGAEWWTTLGWSS